MCFVGYRLRLDRFLPKVWELFPGTFDFRGLLGLFGVPAVGLRASSAEPGLLLKTQSPGAAGNPEWGIEVVGTGRCIARLIVTRFRA